MKTEQTTGSNLPQEIKVGSGEKVAAISSSAFTSYWTWRANGVHKKVPFYSSRINANSRVFVSISEYSSDASTTRFIGDARMNVYNVAPFNGGFYAWVEISWDNPLLVRFDVFVDP